MIKSILNYSRYLVVAAVLGSLVAALALAFIEIVDLFLLGTVFLMIALGLYELFVDEDLDLPRWLSINSFDDLKNKLVGVVVVVLAVLFLGAVVGWDGSRDLLGFGVGVALVIAALTYFLATAKSDKGKGEK